MTPVRKYKRKGIGKSSPCGTNEALEGLPGVYLLQTWSFSFLCSTNISASPHKPAAGVAEASSSPA